MAYPYCPWCKSSQRQHDTDRGRPRISDEKLIDEIQRLYDEFGRVTVTLMERYGRYSHSTYMAPWHFGSWTDALDAADVPQNVQVFTDAELIEDYRRVADKLGRVPSKADLDDHGMVSSTTYRNRLGTSSELAEQYLDIPQPDTR